MVKQEVMMDASVTLTPRKPTGKTSYTLEPEGQEPMQRSLQSGVYQKASWAEKGEQQQ